MKFFVRKSTLLLFFFSMLAIAFYFLIGKSALDGDVDFQFYADSLTYERLYKETYFDSLSDMVAVDGNFLGPLLVLELLGGGRVLVLCFNLFLLFASLRLIQVSDNYNWSLFLIFLFLSPLTLSSLVSINKEILSIFCFSLLVGWVFGRGAWCLIAALIVSFFVRWQLSVFIFLVVASITPVNPLRNKRFVYVSLILVAVSLVYFLVRDSFSYINVVAEQGALSDSGSGVYSALIALQDKGLYFLAFIPKSLHAMFGYIFKIRDLFAPANIYNDVFVALHCWVFFIMFGFALVVGRVKLRDDLVFIAIIYCVVFVLTPIFSPRYFYPVFFLLCLVLSRRSEAVKLDNV